MARHFFVFSQRALLLITLGIFLAALLFFFRWTFTYQANLPYLQDLYDHSQWSVAESTRRMSDNELYQHVSWKTTQGGDLRSYNPEVPPLGKYLLGFTMALTGNPFTLSWLLFFGTTGVFWVLLRVLNTAPRNQLLAIWLLVTNPLFFSQVAETMMDLPLVFFFLLHVLFFVLAQKSSNRKTLLYILSGLALGWMSGLKFPLFTPVILAVEGLWLWREHGLLPAIKTGLLLATATVVGYLSCFLPAFWQGFTLAHWIELQRWMVGFYRTSSVQAQYGVALITVFTGWYRGWWGPEWQRVETWTLAWPLAGLATALGWRIPKKQLLTPQNEAQSIEQLLLALTTILFLVNFVIPFWPRYLLLILPLGSLFLARLLRKLPTLMTNMLIIVIVLQALLRLWPSPFPVVENFSERWQSGAYEEMYSTLDSNFTQTMTRKEFAQVLRQVETNMTLHQPPKVRTVYLRNSSEPWQATTTYATVLGAVTNENRFAMTQENGQWKVVWDWDLVLPEFSPDASFSATLTPVYPLTVYSADNRPLAVSTIGHQVIVEPAVFATDSANLEENLKRLAVVTDGRGTVIRGKLFVLARGQEHVPVGVINQGIDPNALTEIDALPGVSLKEFPLMQLAPALQELNLEDEVEFLNDLRTATQIRILRPMLFSGQLNYTPVNGEPSVLAEISYPVQEAIYLPMTIQELIGSEAENIP